MIMLEPAMLHKEAVINGLKKHIYDDEMIYYSGWNGYSIPNIPDEFESGDYRYAILDKEKVIGYFCYHYDMYSKTLSSFGLYSFDRGNPIIGRDVFREIRRVIKEYQPHRMEWRMISGNPVEKHYDRFCKKYNGKKFILTDVIKDKYGNYHDDIIYEILFENAKKVDSLNQKKNKNTSKAPQNCGKLKHSGIPGVRYDRKSGNWEAHIRKNNVEYQLGYHGKNLESAIRARRIAEQVINDSPELFDKWYCEEYPDYTPIDRKARGYSH